MNKSKTQQVFKPLEDSPGYSVSRMGEVRNDGTGRILKTRMHRSGSMVVGLVRKVRKVTNYVHRLVADCFVPGRDELNCVVGFKDKDRRNVSASNLYWFTHREAKKTSGSREGNKLRGEAAPWRKLSWAAVDQIKERYNAGSKMNDLAKEYKVTREAISKVVHFKTWKLRIIRDCGRLKA